MPGLRVGPIDVEAVLARRDDVIARLDDAGQVPWLDERGVTLVRGRGRLDGERRVVVDGEHLVARNAVIVATGSPARAPHRGAARGAAVDQPRGDDGDDVPTRLAIVGGGVVAVELGDAWSALGSRDRRAPGPAPDRARGAVRRRTGRRGPARGRRRPAARRAGYAGRDGTVRLELDDGTTVEADEVLAALGRRPCTADIGLDTIGLEADGPLDVDDDLRVPGHDWLYAVGDVNGRALLTPWASTRRGSPRTPSSAEAGAAQRRARSPR